MWRTLLVAVLLVLAGCATTLPGSGGPSETASPSDHRALKPDDGTSRANPWGESTLTVAVNNTANESRDFRPLVRDALGFWSNSSEEYAGFPVDYELVSNASGGTAGRGEEVDVVVKFVDKIEQCANVTDPAGCAPYVTRRGQVSRPITVEIAGSYSNNSTRLILQHELGHTLGLNHSAEPQRVMSHTSQLTTLPMTNATDRTLPWRDSNFTVYVDDDNASNLAAARRQVRHALDYYAAGANGTVPANVSYTVTDNRSTADVVVEFADSLPCRDAKSGSCGRVQGVDPDGDGALERYDNLHVTVSGLATDAVGWHVGYWLGYGFGFHDPGEWPAPFRDASYRQRRSNWWD
ncbi:MULTISPECIES: matrixin family metalloprotease [Halorussus]|uniref:matrixin family metalloprotease n=1 Tax=Halorussus TaxID=1070314 RepID=UPI00209D0522|nr:matrixin family metalloprotease [Halorussus vallis]USZ74557.1 matrixin family metalloprotease [Halorussus vallis]